MTGPQQAAPDQAVRRFLRLCLRGRWDPTAFEAARTLAAHGDFDWDVLYQIARAEHLAPLLYHLVHGQHVVPPPVEQYLRRVHADSASCNMFRLHELEDMVHHLAAEGVAVILLKGVALTETVYGRIPMRPMRDLDLLVRRADVPTALRVLAAIGYAPVGVEPHAGADVAYENEVLLCKPGLIGVLLEVHWSLFDSPYYQQRLPMDWFWQTALSVRMGSTPALVLGPEAQILHLCGHLLLHHGSGDEPELLWLHDVAEVMAFYQEQIDWQQVLARAQAYDLVLPVQQVLTRVADEWSAPIPADVLKQLSVLFPSRDEVRIFNWLTAEQRPVAQRFGVDLASMPSWQQRLRYAWINLFPSPAYMRHRYHIPRPFLVPLYYPYRWLLGLRSAL